MDAKIERQREHFNSIAERYAAGRADANHQRIKSLIWRSVGEDLKALRGRRVRMLEPMCGYAEGRDIAEHIWSLDCDYAGFDYSDVIVERLAKTHADSAIWQADVTTYRPASAAFDLMVLIGGLHHVPDAAPGVVARLADGLASGGLFVSFEPTSGNPLFKRIRDKIYHGNEIFDEKTERAFSVSEYEGFFRAAGLERVRIIYPGLLAYVLYYNTYAFPFLNRGGQRLVDAAFAIDKIFMSSRIGRLLSFATLSIWRKPA